MKKRVRGGSAIGGFRVRDLLCLFGLYPLLVASVGAIAARPIADDYASLANATDGLVGGFTRWMSEWTGYYSYFWLLNVSAWLSTPGAVDIVFPVMSLALLGLLTLSLRQCVLALNDLEAVTLPVWPATAVLVAGALGSLTLFVRFDPGVLFGALYWQALWMGHIVPLLLLPFALRLLRRNSERLPGAHLLSGLLVGFVLAGFAFALTGIIGTAIVVHVLVIAVLHRQKPAGHVLRSAGALIVGLMVGTTVAFVMPGTGRRQDFLAEERPHSVSLEKIGRSVFDAGDTALVHSPALLLGLATGLLFVWVLTTTQPRRRTLDVLALGAVLVVVAGTVWVGVGDAVSYPAFWHLWPLLLTTYAAATLVGAAVAARWKPPVGGDLVAGLAAVVLIVFASVETHTAARLAWDRQQVFDANLPLQDGMWTAQPVGAIADLEPPASHWMTQAAAEWLGKRPEEMQVRVLPPLLP